MTDLHTYTKDDGTVLLELSPDWRSANNGKLLVKLPIVSAHDSVLIPAARLLAMIDAADPDAMRAYLRETLMHEDRENLRAYLEPEQLDAIPEADSPEDVDEHAVIELSDDIDTRLHVIERLAKILRAGTDAVEVCTLADWVIDR